MESRVEKTYSITINIDPKPKKRPRVYRWSTINPSQEDEEELAANVINHSNCPEQPLTGQIRVMLKFYQRAPKNTPKWKIPLMDRGDIRPNINPDVDNYVKLVLDALNGIIWEDDRYIVEIHASKYYSINPRIEIFVDQIPEIKHRKDLEKLKDLEDLEKFFE